MFAQVIDRLNLQHQDMRVFINSQWLLIDRVLRVCIGILLSAWIARFLGGEDYGRLRYVISFVSLFGPIGELGLNSIAVREFVVHKKDKNRLIGTLFSLKFVGGLLAVITACAASFFIHQEEKIVRYLIIIISLGIAFQSFDVIDFYFQSRIESKFVVYAKAVVFFFSTAIKIVLILGAAPLIAFGWVIFAESIMNATALLIIYRLRNNVINETSVSIKRAKLLLRSSYPLIFSGIMKILFLRIDQIMIANMLNTKTLANYSIAVQISEGFFFIAMILHSSIFPTIIEAKKISEAYFYQRLQRFYNLLAFCGYFVAIIITISSHWVIDILFGPEYMSASNILALLIWTLPLVNTGVGRAAFLISEDMTKFHFLSMTGACFLNIAMNYYLIPNMGAMGAAWASIVSYGFAGYVSSFFYKPLFRTGLMQTKSLIYSKFW